ncbi:MAG TPA: M14 family metallocarboxypeptidase [Opitutaceae bacterium]
MSAVKASAFDPAALVQHCVKLAAARRFRVERIGEVAGCPLVALTRRTPGPRPRIYLSTGVHGDEPAPPQALAQLLEHGVFDERADWFLVPMLNPTGFHRGTRENAAGVDLNRDYKDRRTAEVTAHVHWLERQPLFDLALCLHEDWEAKGFYLYELNPEGRPTLADAIIAAARVHSPIEDAAVIDGRQADAPGIIRPVNDPLLREDWPEAIYLRAHHARLGYTFETASTQSVEQRVATLAAAVGAAISMITAPAV